MLNSVPSSPSDQTVCVAAVQAEALEYPTDAEFRDHILKLVAEAKEGGAQIVVFPEDVCVWLEFARNSPRTRALKTLVRLPSFTRFVAGKRPKSVPAQIIHGAGASAAIGEALIPPPAQIIPEWRKWLDEFLAVCIQCVVAPFFGPWLSQCSLVHLFQQTFSDAARINEVVIVGGSVYERRGNKIFVTCYVFDSDGSVAGKYDKHHLVTAERCFGASPSTDPVKPIETKDFTIGACICYDLNFGPMETDPAFRTTPVAKLLKEGGAQIICAGSTGVRPRPDYPYHLQSDAPQIRRAIETQLSVVRAYQTGWLVQNLLFMDGLTNMILPNGTIAEASYPTLRQDQRVFVHTVPLAPRVNRQMTGVERQIDNRVTEKAHGTTLGT